MTSLVNLLDKLDTIVDDYLKIVCDARVPEKVRMHDLRHMAFWHGYYAKVVGAIAQGEAPDVLRGTYKVINKHAQDMHRDLDDETLRNAIRSAQSSVVRSLPQLGEDQMIPYKKGSRDYRRDSYVETVIDHFDMHIRYLEKIAAGAPESFYVFHH